MAATLTPVWTADELETELRKALDLVARLAPPEDLRAAVFSMASNALLQRVVERAPVGLTREDVERLTAGA